MKIKRVLTAALVLTMVFAGTVAVQAKHFRRHPGSPAMMGPKLLGLKTVIELNLSDKQESKILSIIQQYETNRENLKQSLVSGRSDLAKALEAEQFNETEVRNAFRHISSIQEDLLVLKAETMTELKTVLTPEQLQLLKERKAERRERRKARFGSCLEDSSE
jgi:Spy/CpxP family protein refolding chaperone